MRVEGTAEPIRGRVAARGGALASTLALALGLTVLTGLSTPSLAQDAGERPGPKVTASLIAPVTAIRAGESVTVALRQVIEPDWHTYWINPGDSGEPTRLTWSLPEGFSASAIEWPTPERLAVGPLMNFGYSNEVLLPVAITPPATLPAGDVVLKARVDLLVCKDICIPETKDVALTLAVAADGAPLPASTDASRIAAALRALPVASPWPMGAAADATRVRLGVEAPGLDASRVKRAEFFADAWGITTHAAAQTIVWRTGGFDLDIARGERAGEQLPRLTGLLVLTEDIGGREVRQGFIVDAAASTVAALPGVPAGAAQADPAGTIAASARPSADPALSLWQALLLAFAGGLILNLMPCVLPILSLKVMALAAEADTGRQAGLRHGRMASLAYLAGVVASFTALAGLIIGFRAAGESIGWGFQFQSPAFVLAMAALFLAMGLSLSGVFNVTGGFVGAGDGLTRQGGAAGSFFTGVLATLAATPCTAPFMGAAIGYAVTRPAVETLLVLEALALGFALPMVLVASSGAVRRLMPRPGPWMETLKQALAFPLYATAAWLVWVLSVQAGPDGVLAAGVVLTAVAVAAWIVGLAQWPLGTRVAIASALAVLAAGLAVPSLDGPATGTATAARTGGSGAVEAGEGEAYSAARVAALRAEGRNVLVNLTAAWCITCKVNERVALSSDGFRAALAEHRTAYVKGDWTRQDPAISALLSAHGRAGVPLYLLYPADVSAPAVVLPQLLTEAIVVSHLAALPPLRTAQREPSPNPTPTTETKP